MVTTRVCVLMLSGLRQGHPGSIVSEFQLKNEGAGGGSLSMAVSTRSWHTGGGPLKRCLLPMRLPHSSKLHRE